MTGPVVADTDLVIDYLRGRGEGAELLPSWLRSRRLRLTAITLFELRSGTDWGARRLRIEALFIGGPLPFEREAALHSGQIHMQLRAQGESIGLADLQQAGICLARSFPLATRNRSHFDRIPDLALIDVTNAG